jgi:hypothetical protein
VPTIREWCDAAYSISGLSCTSVWQDDTAVVSTLKLSLAGLRTYSASVYFNQGVYGHYWASSPGSIYGYALTVSSTRVTPMNNANRANGYSVRCLKN